MPRVLTDTELKRMHRSWRRSCDARMALLLENVKGPYNVGALMRTAAALQVEKLYAVGFDGSWTDAKVQKTALGTHRFLEFHSFTNTDAAVEAIRTDGFNIIGLELATEAQPVWELDLQGDTCIAVGHEDKGLTPKLLALCDHVGYIPLLGKVGSLNVATAASMALYEARRQSLSLKSEQITQQ